MSTKAAFDLVANNPDLRRTPSRDWAGEFIKGGLYGIPKTPKDLINTIKSSPGWNPRNTELLNLCPEAHRISLTRIGTRGVLGQPFHSYE